LYFVYIEPITARKHISFIMKAHTNQQNVYAINRIYKTETATINYLA